MTQANYQYRSTGTTPTDNRFILLHQFLFHHVLDPIVSTTMRQSTVYLYLCSGSYKASQMMCIHVHSTCSLLIRNLLPSIKCRTAKRHCNHRIQGGICLCSLAILVVSTLSIIQSKFRSERNQETDFTIFLFFLQVVSNTNSIIDTPRIESQIYFYGSSSIETNITTTTCVCGYDLIIQSQSD